MKIFTNKQKKFFISRNIEAGKTCMFPRWGFTFYADPSYTTVSQEHFNTNPFTRSLDHERFVVKEIINGFCRGNFELNPHEKDFYLSIEELKRRDMIEITLLYIFCTIPMIVYNLFKGEYKQKDNS